MKLTSLFIVFLFFFGITVGAQNAEIDSISLFTQNIENSFNDKNYNKTLELSAEAIKKYGENDSIIGLSNLFIGKVYFEQKQYGDAVESFYTAIEYLTKNEIQGVVYESYLNLGHLYRLKRDYNEATDNYLKALEVVIDKYSDKDEKLIIIYKQLSRLEKLNTNYSKSLEYADKGITLSNYYKNDEEKAVLLTYKADVYQFQRVFNTSIKYYLEAIKIKEDLFGIYHRSNVISYTNLAGAYAKLDYINKSIEYQERAIAINEELDVDKKITSPVLYSNLGVYYTEFDQPRKALEYHKKAIVILEKELDKDHPLTARFYKNIGDSYFDLRDYENAKVYYKGVINFSLKHDMQERVEFYEALLSLGLIEKNKSNFDASIKYLEELLQICPDDFFLINNYRLELVNVLIADNRLDLAKKGLDLVSKEIKNGDLSILDIDQIKDKRYFLSTQIDYFKSISNPSEIEVDSLKMIYKKVVALDDYTIKEYTTSATKEFRINDSYPLYEGYVEQLLDSNNDEGESIFEILEKTKARKLIENFNKAKNYVKAKVPDSLLNLERSWNIELINYEEEKSDEVIYNQGQSDSLIAFYDTKIFELKRKQEQLQEQFKEEYPDYYNSVYNLDVANINNVQKELLDNQSLVEYFVGENNIFVFLITKNEYLIKKIKKDFPLKKWISQLREGINNYWSNSNASNEDLEKYNSIYREMGFKLYQKLIEPINEGITEKVIIIPDGELNLIPFDALLTKDSKNIVNARALPYLLKKHQISYDYSATHNNRLKQKERSSSNNNVLAFAPKFSTSTNLDKLTARANLLGDLKFNVEEVEIIGDLLESQIFKNEFATKSNFIANAKDFNIIHLSTHAKANDISGDYSFVAFSNEGNTIHTANDKLYARELYNLDLNADMVVLSACETGVGEIKKGEGVIGLARAFSYAGAKSTITSLWNVNDAQTSKLMELFYTNIKAGLPKDEALHKAKLSYIENEELSAPYFWAAFIPAGNMDPISFKNDTLMYIIGSFIIITIILFVILYRKKKAVY